MGRVVAGVRGKRGLKRDQDRVREVRGVRDLGARLKIGCARTSRTRVAHPGRAPSKSSAPLLGARLGARGARVRSRVNWISVLVFEGNVQEGFEAGWVGPSKWPTT